MQHDGTPCTVVDHSPAMPLARAALCLDCETVFALDAGACPSCGGTAIFLLAKWVNRAEGK